jgi:biopolymer transport protein ExbD
MAGGGKDTGNGIIGGINVTPLVDITLVLLIIFMVTAKLVIAPSTALPLTLPKAATGEAMQVVFAISLTSDGKAFIDGKPVPGDDAIKTRAADELAQHPDLRAVIQADGDVPHKRVIHVMDLLSQAHVSQIAFAVVPEPPRAGAP